MLAGLPAWSGSATAGTTEILAKLKEVPFTQVQIHDRFWAPRRETNRVVSIPHNLDMLEKAGNVHNFELAAAGAHTGYTGPVFMDSDLYKGLEAASYVLATDPDPALDRRLDALIAKIAAAQRPDGYLNTHFEVNAPDKRWTNLRDWHELYCAGHLFEAAVAHFQATGKRSLLNVAIRYADYIDSVFGDGPGKRMGYPGHPEIELALVKLWRVTGDKKYFDLARFFIENRGRKFFATEHHTPLNQYDGTYWQDDVPIRDHKTIAGHAVRAGYLLSGAVDVAAETGDQGLLKMINRVWRNTTEKRMYLTGGIGPSASNEGFTEDYDLPNLTAYQETCASVAMVLWNHRLNLLYGDSRYADVMERALYNGVLAGGSLDGTRYFYVNPLASAGRHHRSGWFGCACCPPNEARTLACLGGYAYATSDQAIWVNLYIQGSMNANVRGKQVKLEVTTDYPWDGLVSLKPRTDSPVQFQLRLRVPAWCTGATVAVNGQALSEPAAELGYLVLDREWKTGDVVELNLPMPAQRIVAHPSVKEDRGLAAIQRGPLVYCLEGCDQTEPLADLVVPLETGLQPEQRPNLLGGVVVLQGMAKAATVQDWTAKLYQSAPVLRSVPIVAIPYYAWDNRQACPMEVWLPLTPPTPRITGPETKAKVSLSFTSDNCQPQGINDGLEPKSSNDHPGAICHWWPHKGTAEWAQYTWPKPGTFESARVYWFDDSGSGECRLPASWQILYLNGGAWKPVQAQSAYSIKRDQWCDVTFAPVTTTALRLEVKLQPRWAAGVQEWKVFLEE